MIARLDKSLNHSEIVPFEKFNSISDQIKKFIDREWWTDGDGSKRKIMAECLIPDIIPSQKIQTIYVALPEIAEEL